MQVKRRLQINAALSTIAAATILLTFFFSMYRIIQAAEASEIADGIITNSFERVTLRNDYVQRGSERAKEQWFSKHGQIDRLLSSAMEKFEDPLDQKTIAEMVADHESIGGIFSGIVKNREKTRDRAHMDELALETEERLLTQLNMRIYGLVLRARGLQESSRETLFSTLRLAILGITCVLILVFAAVIVNSWTMGRSITEQIRRLRDGVSTIRGGKLDHKIDVRGDDEIAVLSNAFNAMSTKLLRSYNDLEKEIRERTKAEEIKQELNEELIVTNDRLLSANRELEAFIYSVSHDLRQPLRAISSFSQIVKKSLYEGLAEKEKSYLARIIDSAVRMSDIIESMLKLSQISRQEIKPVEIDMTRMAEAVVSGMREAHPERCAEVVIEAGLAAVADQGMMATVIENMLGNAWKFTSKTEKACIEFGATDRDNQTVYFIRDNGVGFDPQYAKNMFKPFHRLHPESEFEGTGIGLSIVERIIERHGGKVWAEGDIGKGATVFFTLPYLLLGSRGPNPAGK